MLSKLSQKVKKFLKIRNCRKNITMSVSWRIFTFCLECCLGPKKEGFWPKINCSQMKLPNFVSQSADSSSKSANFGLSK